MAQDLGKNEPGTPSPPPPLTKKGYPLCTQPLRYRWWAELCTIFGVGGFALLFFGWLGRLTSVTGLVANLAAAAAGHGVTWYFYDRYTARLRAKALKHRLALCLRCGYALDGLPSEHACPECGQSYTLDETRQPWRKWFVSGGGGIGSHDMLDAELQRVETWEESIRRRRNCLRCGTSVEHVASRACPNCGATPLVLEDFVPS